MQKKLSLADQWLKPYFDTMPFEEYIILDRSVRILESNQGGGKTQKDLPWYPLRAIMPADGYFNGIWNWDCAFHAMGTAKWDTSLARDQILAFCRMQQEDGMFPDVKFKDGNIFTGCTKPPVMPWAAWCVEQHEHDPEFLKEVYAVFEKNERFWMEKRGGALLGMFHYDGNSDDPEKRHGLAGLDSGWDNSPRWDNDVCHIFAIDLNCYMVLFYRSMAWMAEKLGFEEKKKEWQKKEQILIQRIEETFWDAESECYLDYNFSKKTFVKAISPASFMPLFLRTASPERAAAMSKIAKDHFDPGWPSISYHHSEFDPEGYWRGRTWLNIAYFALKGLKNYGYTELAENGKQTLLDWVRNSNAISENYHPLTGEALGVPRFSWSAVFCIKFLTDWDSSDFAE